MKKKKSKDLKTTIPGAVAATATAAAPFFPQYSLQIAAVQAVSMALWAFFTKDKG